MRVRSVRYESTGHLLDVEAYTRLLASLLCVHEVMARWFETMDSINRGVRDDEPSRKSRC